MAKIQTDQNKQMKRVFKFKEGQETEDFGDTDMYDFLWEYMLKPTAYWLPKFKKNYKVTIIIEEITKKELVKKYPNPIVGFRELKKIIDETFKEQIY